VTLVTNIRMAIKRATRACVDNPPSFIAYYDMRFTKRMMMM
jgi:hypothetical protein